MVIKWNSKVDDSLAKLGGPRRAAEYVRMSTEHQQYSTDNQSDAIRRYAQARGYEVVRTYADEGKSGLNLGGRAALQSLLQDIEKGEADFEAIIVYDVSRWGRFQDPDEAATYELRCRQAGVVVHYCAEQFENDGSIGSSIIKTVKRAMAGEYSRELSVKVFAGQANLIRLGFRQGGAAGFGLRRMLIGGDGNHKGILAPGEHKSIQTDRVILIPGPDFEQRLVREAYQRFVAGETEQEIASRFNERDIPTDLGRSWTRGTIHQLLLNEKYIGNNVWARTSFKLKQAHVENQPDDWIRCDAAFKPIVSCALFDEARALIANRATRISDEAMLQKLASILANTGHLTGLIIDESEGCPSSSSYRTRFGSLLRAYALIGFEPSQDYRYLEINKALRVRHPLVVSDIVAGISGAGGEPEIDVTTDLVWLSQEISLAVVIARCFQTSAGSLRWKLRLDSQLQPDLTVAVRMRPSNEEVLDYYLLPRLDMREALLRLCEYNGLSLDSYRRDNLETLYAFAARAPLRRAA